MLKREKNDCEDYMISIDGKSGAVICGCVFVDDYSKTEIKLRLKKSLVIIRGKDMTLKSYYPSEIHVKGFINEIKIEKGDLK